MATDMSSTWNLCVLNSTKTLISFSKKPVIPNKNKAVFALVGVNGHDIVLNTGSVPSSKTKRRRAFLMEESSGKIVGMEFTDVAAGYVIFRNIESGLYKIIIDGNDLADGDGGNFKTVTYDKISVP